MHFKVCLPQFSPKPMLVFFYSICHLKKYIIIICSNITKPNPAFPLQKIRMKKNGIAKTTGSPHSQVQIE